MADKFMCSYQLTALTNHILGITVSLYWAHIFKKQKLISKSKFL